MITITQDQALASDPSWQAAVGGEFAPDALVECYRVSDPEQRLAYYASFISTEEYPQ